MHDGRGMRGRERIGDLGRQPQRALGRERSGGDKLGEGAALDVLHGDVVQTGVGIDLIDGQDAGVVQSGSGLGFPEEAPPPVGVAGPLGTDDLERRQAAEPFVPGLVDDAHAALAHGLENTVVPDGSSRQRAGASHDPLR
jgi:hypothetical protein